MGTQRTRSWLSDHIGVQSTARSGEKGTPTQLNESAFRFHISRVAYCRSLYRMTSLGWTAAEPSWASVARRRGSQPCHPVLYRSTASARQLTLAWISVVPLPAAFSARPTRRFSRGPTATGKIPRVP